MSLSFLWFSVNLFYHGIIPGPDLKPIRPCLVKNVGAVIYISDISDNSMTMTSSYPQNICVLLVQGITMYVTS